MTPINVKVPVKFTANQIKKMKAAHKKKSDVSIRMTPDQMFVQQQTKDVLDMLVPEATFKKMRKAKMAGKGCCLTMTHSHQSGGFLPLLLGLLPEIGTAIATGLAGGAATAAGSAIINAITGKGMTPLSTVPPPRTRGRKKKNPNLIRY